MTSDALGLTSEVNPSNIRPAYLQALNRCFPGWGGDQRFTWSFDRALGGPQADLLVLRSGDDLLAGSAVTYRQLRLPNENAILAGIMTGSWTLPAARARGCFSRMIEDSVAIARAAGAAVLLAFVTHDNPSARRLLAAGSAAFPTRYIFSEHEESRSVAAGTVPAPTMASQLDLEEIVRIRQQAGLGHTRVSYDVAQWRSQFVEGGEGNDLLRFGDIGWCAVETTDQACRLQATALHRGADPTGLLRSLITFADARLRGTFLFSMDTTMIKAAEAMGMGSKPGYLTALVADAPALARATASGRSWSEANSRILADPNSDWYIGPWFVESGDRM